MYCHISKQIFNNEGNLAYCYMIDEYMADIYYK